MVASRRNDYGLGNGNVPRRCPEMSNVRARRFKGGDFDPLTMVPQEHMGLYAQGSLPTSSGRKGSSRSYTGRQRVDSRNYDVAKHRNREQREARKRASIANEHKSGTNCTRKSRQSKSTGKTHQLKPIYGPGKKAARKARLALDEQRRATERAVLDESRTETRPRHSFSRSVGSHASATFEFSAARLVSSGAGLHLTVRS